MQIPSTKEMAESTDMPITSAHCTLDNLTSLTYLLIMTGMRSQEKGANKNRRKLLLSKLSHGFFHVIRKTLVEKHSYPFLNAFKK